MALGCGFPCIPGYGLQVYKSYLHWGLKSINNTYLGLFGALGFRAGRGLTTQAHGALRPPLDVVGRPTFASKHSITTSSKQGIPKPTRV